MSEDPSVKQLADKILARIDKGQKPSTTDTMKLAEGALELADALQRVTRLFGKKGWPQIEVIMKQPHNRQVLPISDDDADHVRHARKLCQPVKISVGS